MLALVKRDISLPDTLPTIIGIDGALAKSGLCVIHRGEVFTMPFYTKLKGAERLSYLKTTLLQVIDHYKPQYASIEGYAYGGQGRVFDLAEAGGLFRLSLYEANIPTVEVPPTSMKKYVTGEGFAKKNVVLKYINSMFKCTFKIKEIDEAEAFAFAVCGLDYFNNPMSDVESFRDYLHSSCKQIVGEANLRLENKEAIAKFTPKQLKELRELRELTDV